MTTFTWILAATVAGGIVSVLGAWLIAARASAAHVPILISYAVGALLGAVFIELLPHAFSRSDNLQTTAATILGGLMLFFILEKLVLWRHCHNDVCEVHSSPVHDHGRSGLMITIGDTFHNFVDGLIIAGAFLTDFRLGVVTSLAIVAHEIPQEIGDFLILLHSGYTRTQALLLNVLSAFATVVGALIGYYLLSMTQGWAPVLLGIAGASMIYVALSDLIPGLHKRPELGATLQQLILIGLGIFSVWGVGQLVGH